MLRNKTVFLLSPDKWGKIHVSKHNYAKALTERNNRVYYFNPIDSQLPAGSIVVEDTEIEHLKQVSFNPRFPLWLKFKMPALFYWLMNIVARNLLKKLKVKPDIIWDFNVYPVFADLRVFNAKVRVLHAVDSSSRGVVPHRNADVAFSVSPQILKTIDKSDLPKYFINHGLAPHFLKDNIVTCNKDKNKIDIAYVGNLLIHSLDYRILYEVVAQHPDVTFHLIGPYEKDSPSHSPDLQEGRACIEKLKQLGNARLYGPKSNAEVKQIIQTMDGFIICYKETNLYHCDNSHKILELFSTGKVVITNPILVYENSDLIEVNRDGTVDGFLQTFRGVIHNLEYHNSSSKCMKRRRFAEDNIYPKQLDKIEEVLAAYLVD